MHRDYLKDHASITECTEGTEMRERVAALDTRNFLTRVMLTVNKLAFRIEILRFFPN